MPFKGSLKISTEEKLILNACNFQNVKYAFKKNHSTLRNYIFYVKEKQKKYNIKSST